MTTKAPIAVFVYNRPDRTKRMLEDVLADFNGFFPKVRPGGIGAIPEVIGPAGLIVPEGDVSGLARAVQTAIFDGETRHRLVQQGLQRAEHELNTRVMAERLLNFYNRILGS